MRHPYPVSFSVKSSLGNGNDVPVQPNQDLVIGSDLSKEMSRQPALFAYYAALAEEEHQRSKRLKFRIYCLEEELDEQYRKTATKRMTERELNNKIKRNPKMRALYTKYIATQRRAGHLRALKEAFDQRSRMLQSIGAMTRRELETELRTLQRRAEKWTTSK